MGVVTRIFSLKILYYGYFSKNSSSILYSSTSVNNAVMTFLQITKDYWKERTKSFKISRSAHIIPLPLKAPIFMCKHDKITLKMTLHLLWRHSRVDHSSWEEYFTGYPRSKVKRGGVVLKKWWYRPTLVISRYWIMCVIPLFPCTPCSCSIDVCNNVCFLLAPCTSLCFYNFASKACPCCRLNILSFSL